MGRGLETAQLVSSISRQAVERARAHRELELAREVQERLLPGSLPSVAGVDASAAYRSAEQIGGDYYDLFPLADGSVCLVIADVSGKGVPAALLMAALRASIHALLQDRSKPVTTIVEQLNSLLYQASSASRYATLFLCLYETASGRLTYVNAGHNPPLLVRGDGLTRTLGCGGTVIGLLPGAIYESESLVMNVGDTLVAYTDGVTEANNSQGQEWGEDALKSDVLRSMTEADVSAKHIAHGVLVALDRFVGNAVQTDDITLVVLRRRETD